MKMFLVVIIIIETVLLIASGLFISQHLKCYHNSFGSSEYNYGERDEKYNTDKMGQKKHVRRKKSKNTNRK